MDFMTFIVMGLATWRLASLFANESGPFKMFERLRNLCAYLCDKFWVCREFQLYELIECEWCNSVWFGVILTALFIFDNRITFLVCLPLALSACAVIVKLLVVHPVWLQNK